MDKRKKMVDVHKNITTELLLATEDYRIDKIYELLKTATKDSTKQKAICYLLSYSDLLDKNIAKEVVDMANKMLSDSLVRDSVKVKIAADLKSFLGGAGKTKKTRTSFEELRKEDGFIEVEVPD